MSYDVDKLRIDVQMHTYTQSHWRTDNQIQTTTMPKLAADKKYPVLYPVHMFLRYLCSVCKYELSKHSLTWIIFKSRIFFPHSLLEIVHFLSHWSRPRTHFAPRVKLKCNEWIIVLFPVHLLRKQFAGITLKIYYDNNNAAWNRSCNRLVI